MSRTMFSLILLIVITLLLLFWHQIGYQVLHVFYYSYSFFMRILKPFVGDHTIRQVVVLLLVPLLLALIPAFIYWIMRRRWLYEYMHVVWCIWLVIMTLILVRQG